MIKNDTRSTEYSENIGLSFENMRNKGPFDNNTFENCIFNFNSKKLVRTDRKYFKYKICLFDYL